MRNVSKKTLALVVSLTLVLGVVGGTLAYLLDTSNTVKNTFIPSEVTTKVTETVTETEKTNVAVQNTGDTEAYIRAAIVVNWADGNGNVYGKTPITAADYEMEFYTDADDGKEGEWIDSKVSGDGFYYWTKPVAAGDETGLLIKSVKLAQNVTAPEGYALSVEILCSGVQSVPAEAVEAWSNGLYTIGDGNVLVAKS